MLNGFNSPYHLIPKDNLYILRLLAVLAYPSRFYKKYFKFGQGKGKICI